MATQSKPALNMGARDVIFKLCSERVAGGEGIPAEGPAYTGSCGRVESVILEELKESQYGWRIVREGEQVWTTLHQFLGDLLKIVHFVPTLKGFKQGSNISSFAAHSGCSVENESEPSFLDRVAL